jgi:hypothetical protein
MHLVCIRSLSHHRLESTSPEDFHHHLHRQSLECSSHILSDCSLTLYPPESTPSYPRKSTQSSLAIPFHSTACPYEGVNRVIISFFIRHLHRFASWLIRALLCRIVRHIVRYCIFDEIFIRKLFQPFIHTIFPRTLSASWENYFPS